MWCAVLKPILHSTSHFHHGGHSIRWGRNCSNASLLQNEWSASAKPPPVGVCQPLVSMPLGKGDMPRSMYSHSLLKSPRCASCKLFMGAELEVSYLTRPWGWKMVSPCVQVCIWLNGDGTRSLNTHSWGHLWVCQPHKAETWWGFPLNSRSKWGSQPWKHLI